jgi:hypothetical protein
MINKGADHEIYQTRLVNFMIGTFESSSLVRDSSNLL